MGKKKYNHKRGAPGGKGGHNPINSQPPREHIVIVGGPTNTFNAWWSLVDLKSSHPDSGEDSFFSAQPAPRTMRELDYYLRTAPTAVPAGKESDPDALRKAGWSKEGLKELKDLGWSTNDIEAVGPETHDLYWANFVDCALRLYSQTSELQKPLRRPELRKNDVVTYMIYAPSYVMRQGTDYAASPYNIHHRNKYGVKGNPMYDPSAPKGPKKVHPPSKPATITNERKRQLAEEQAEREKARREFKDKKLSDSDIDHYIMMRTIGDNSGDIIKKPPTGSSYYDYLESIVTKAVKAKDVMTKVLFFDTPQQVLHYLGAGTWYGEEIYGIVDEYELEKEPSDDEKRRVEENRQKLDEFYNIDTDSKYGLHNCQFHPPVPVRKDIHGRPLKWPLHWSRFWDGAPKINRKKVKIARLDFFGHSTDEDLMLQWGWDNKKGETPTVDVDPVTNDEISLTADDFEAVLTGGQLTKDAYACLWGCNTGEKCAPKMAEFFGGGVVATETYTSFAKIVLNDTNMPEPVDGYPWVHYKAKKAATVGAP